MPMNSTTGLSSSELDEELCESGSATSAPPRAAQGARRRYRREHSSRRCRPTAPTSPWRGSDATAFVNDLVNDFACDSVPSVSASTGTTPSGCRSPNVFEDLAFVRCQVRRVTTNMHQEPSVELALEVDDVAGGEVDERRRHRFAAHLPTARQHVDHRRWLVAAELESAGCGSGCLVRVAKARTATRVSHKTRAPPAPMPSPAAACDRSRPTNTPRPDSNAAAFAAAARATRHIDRAHETRRSDRM